MANPRVIKRHPSLWPFLLGLSLGLILSMGLRILSSRSFLFCRKLGHNSLQVEIDANLRNEAKIEPDQIVNLDDVKKSFSQKDYAKMPNNFFRKVKNYNDEDNLGSIKDNLLLVGVMTAERYLHSRALGVYDTWAKSIPGKVIFFTGGNNTDINSNLDHDDGIATHSVTHKTSFPLVALPGVDDSYPPQKKSFMMLKYMYEHYGDKFEWFMRADDDVYIRTEKLSDFLRSINSRHLYFIGQAGRGNRAEKGTLNLGQNENFCMGGPGIILSKPTLAKVAPNVRQCLQDMYSTHEDVEVGRCVQRFAGISCTWAYEMQSIFHHNSSGEKAFTETLKRREIHRAITLHPIKNFQYLYRLDAYFQELKIQELLYESILLQRELLYLHPNSKEASPSGSQSLYNQNQLLQIRQTNAVNDNSALKNVLRSRSWKETFPEPTADMQLNVTGLQPGLNKYLPRDESQIIGWNFISKGIYSFESVNPKLKIDAASKEALEDVVREMMDIINGYSRVRGRVIDFKEILYGYHRVNPLYGDDYVLDLLMTYKKYRGRKMTVPVRRHVYIQRPYSELNLELDGSRKDAGSPPDKKTTKEAAVPSLSHFQQPNLVLIVPLSGRFTTFKRFLDNFGVACMDSVRVNSSVNSNGESQPVEVDPHLEKERYKKSWSNIYRSGPEDSEKGKDSYQATVSSANSSMSLIVVYFGADGEKEKFQQLVNSFREKTSLASCKIKVVQVDGEFSRSIALETGISQCSEDDLLFLIDVDIAFTPDSLQRVRLNVIRGKRVYFPIVFSQYNPLLYKYNQTNKNNNSNFENDRRTDNLNLSSDIGYWREYGFGTAAFFKSDFRLAGGFDVSIKGWGKEDVALFDRFLQTDLIVFRAPDPGLIHIYHNIHCDDKLSISQREMCLGTQASTMGSYATLMQFIFRHRKDSSRFQNLLTTYPLI